MVDDDAVGGSVGEMVPVGESEAFGWDVGLGEEGVVKLRVYTPYIEAIAIIPMMNAAAAMMVFFKNSTSGRGC